ncbi:MAG: DNA methyltransferase, partial [Coriobacteriia bacterium]|nr:DNA methyltransferase [Coriobacteriia bacterium]
MLEGMARQAGEVECLGLVFESDDARREHFRSVLAEKLKDPEYRGQRGFPTATDEDILRMSDPPYYTACPNPFLKDFARVYGKLYDAAEQYHRDPFAVDVSVGKTDALYRAHSYHTKVPHLAIVPSILHYTEPGDIVLDGFCGSGMTGVASQFAGTASPTYRMKLETEWAQQGLEPPKWGARRAVLGDLSPAATSIAAGYNLPFDVELFEREARRILAEVEDELGWVYNTLHGAAAGTVNYTVWSEIYTCPECGGEIVFLQEALDLDSKRVRDTFACPQCGVSLTKKLL